MTNSSNYRSANPTLFEKYYFSSSAIVFVILAIIGFSGSIQLKSAHGFVMTPRIMIHAVSGFLWLLLYVAQTQLALQEKIAYHIKTGKFGVVLFLFLITATTYMLFTARTAYPDRDPQLINSEIGFHFYDLVRTMVLLIFGLINIKRPYLHKRSMFYVSFLIMAPAITRLPNFFGYEENFIIILIVSVLIIFPLLIHDLIKAPLRLKFISLGLFMFLMLSADLNPEEYWLSDEWNSIVEDLDQLLH